MQDVTAIFGPTDAAKYLALLSSNYRGVVYTLEALNNDGTVALDLTPYLQSWNIQFTDENGVVQQATYTLSNPNAMFDPYNNSMVADFIKINKTIRFRKGITNKNTGEIFLLPAHYGKVIQRKPSYTVSGSTVQLVVADALKGAIKQKFTSYPYLNTQTNLIAADLLQRFGNIPANRITFPELDHVLEDVQFPDMALIDAVKVLFDSSLYWVRADEAGNITSGPRLGSPSFGAGLLGYPDQATAPDEELVTYTLPPAIIESVEQEEQDYDGVFTQVKVLGEATVSFQVLGPNQPLLLPADSAIGSKDVVRQQYPFSQQPAGTSTFIAKNVFVKFQYSTNHHLSDEDEVRVIYLSSLPFRGVWNVDTDYAVGDGVEYDDGSGLRAYICSAKARGMDQYPENTAFWQVTEIARDEDGKYPLNILEANAAIGIISSRTDLPWWPKARIWNEDPREVGRVTLESTTSSYIILNVEGKEFSTSGGRHHGGFDYKFTILGQPVLVNNQAITAFADYNAQTVTEEELIDPFSDHVTFQAAHQPFAMSIPVEVFLDSGDGPESLGKIAADQTDLSGESKFGIDWERGRVVLKEVTYQNWSVDNVGSHPLSTGGTAHSAGQVFDLTLPENAAPQLVYQYRREGDSTFTFPALAVGQGYDIRLHFADPVFVGTGQRVFSVFIQGAKVIEGMDIVAKSGGTAFHAWQETISGIAPDETGKIVINITKTDPVTHEALPEAKGGDAIISAIEIVLPQGQGASPYAVNAGGPAINPTPPIVTATYGYSPVQEEYGITAMTVDNPLLTTHEDCLLVGGFWVRHSQWKRNRQSVPCASIPHLQPGDLLRYTNPVTGVQFWTYIESINRTGSTNGADRDVYSTLVLFAEPSA